MSDSAVFVPAAPVIQTVSLAGLFKGESFGSRMIASRGRTTGFDYQRIILAVAVMSVHSTLTTVGVSGDWVWQGYVRPLVSSILPAFFALSGFLVTGSLQRSKGLLEFGLLRALRLVPALFVEVVVAALVLGPLLTRLPLHDYFRDPKLYAYSLNIVGDIHYQLPGLFLDNPDPNMVNRQLWTVPAEGLCYLVLAGLALLGLTSHWKLMLATFLFCVLFFPFFDLVIRHKHVWEMDLVPALALLLCFLTGVTANFLMAWIPLNWSLFAICAALSYAAMMTQLTSYFAAVPLTYVTLFLGLSRPPKTFITATGDYSYGVYLYGYPIQQTYAQLFPHHRIWWQELLFAIPVSLLLAFLSWTFVESQVLKRRVWVVDHATRWLAPVLAPCRQGHARIMQRLRRRWPAEG